MYNSSIAVVVLQQFFSTSSSTAYSFALPLYSGTLLCLALLQVLVYIFCASTTRGMSRTDCTYIHLTNVIMTGAW